MNRTRRRGLSLAILLLTVMVVSVVTAAILTRLQQARHAGHLQVDRTREQYDSVSSLNQVLERVRRGEDLTSAARAVSAETGQEILVAGNRLLVTGSRGSLHASVLPRAWQHVLLARELDLNGLRGAFRKDDPHGPAQGIPPTPTANFLPTIRDRALSGGIHLTADPATCSFQPGGGSWQRTLQDGQAAFTEAGGNRSWTLQGPRWTSENGASLELRGRTWILTAQKGAELQGTLLVEDASLEIQAPFNLAGELVVWNGALRLDAAAQVQPDPGSLAVAVLAGPSAGEPPAWKASPTPSPGDLLLLQGRSRLAVGDPSRPEQTGGLVLASGRLVKKGSRLEVAGVVAAGRAELDGVPAGSLVWSGRIDRLPPENLESQDAHLSFPGVEVEVR